MCIIYHWMMTSQYLHGEQVDELNKDDMLTCHMDCVFNVSCPDEGCVWILPREGCWYHVRPRHVRHHFI